MDSFSDYLKNKNLKETTIMNYLYYFNKFTHPKLNQEFVSRFLSEKTNRNSIARSFLVNYKKFLLVNYKALSIDDYYYKEINEVELPTISGRTQSKLPKTLSHEQVIRVAKQLPTEKLKLMILLSYYGALRLGELLKISVNAFNWEAWKKDPSVMGEIKVFGKGDKEGLCVIPGDLMMRVARYIRSNSFKSIESPIFNVGKRSWQTYLLNAGIKAKITTINENGKKINTVHPHRLRHSYAHHLLINGVDIRYIKEALRHSSIQSTQIYTQLDKEELKKGISSALLKNIESSSAESK